jgi:hypothetical protein
VVLPALSRIAATPTFLSMANLSKYIYISSVAFLASHFELSLSLGILIVKEILPVRFRSCGAAGLPKGPLLQESTRAQICGRAST